MTDRSSYSDSREGFDDIECVGDVSAQSRVPFALRTSTAISGTFSVGDGSSRLSVRTISSLKLALEEYGTRPSPEMWVAIKAMAETMEAMAEDRADETFYLSSLDPGVGKTTTLIHFVRALLSSPEHDHVSVLICVSRLAEIETLISKMGLDQKDFGVRTSDESLNRLGCKVPTDGRVLFTTHAMIMKKLDGQLLTFDESFSYRGSARQVRVWDETMTLGEVLTIERLALAELLRPLSQGLPALADHLEAFFVDLKAAKDGDTVVVPDFAGEHEVSIHQVLDLLADDPGSTPRIGLNQRQIDATTLWKLGGKVATVRHDGGTCFTMLDYRDVLPEDMAPMLILDASGRVKTTYELWEERRRSLTRLPSAIKRYPQLKVHLWGRGGGKSSFRNEKSRQEIAAGVIATINSKPNEKFLVVLHKPTSAFDIEREVRPLIDGDPSRVAFLTWGSHKATNEFSDYPNVILAGVLYYRSSFYEAITRMAQGAELGQAVSRKDVARVELGEHADLILQAACRGAMRRCEGDACAKADLYLIAAPRTGIEAELPSIFPEAQVVRWQPIKTKLSGKVLEAVVFIEAEMEKDPMASISFKTVMQAVGGSDLRNFRKNIRKNAQFVDALAERGIIEHGEGRNPTGFVLEATLFERDQALGAVAESS